MNLRWSEWAEGELDGIRAAGRMRTLRTFDALGPGGVLDGRSVTSFASNDYLGLSTHPTVIEAARDALDRWGTGATASRLIVGTRPIHQRLEAAIADWKHCDAALVFPTGYSANVGAMSALAGPGTVVLSDELNHASIIDGCRQSRATVQVYRHCDVGHLASLLAAAPGRAIVVTDTVFSMDGDIAPLDEIGPLCARHGALLVVDEAHAALGPHDFGAPGLEMVRIGTLSKTLGSLGGWVAASKPIVDLLVNRARSFIFTTGLTPADAAAGLAALGVLRSADGEQLVGRLRGHVERIRPGHPSPVIPIVLGDEDVAVKAAAALLDGGLLIPAIRPPTVPAGTSRLRVALSAAHTDAMIDALVEGLARVGLTP